MVYFLGILTKYIIKQVGKAVKVLKYHCQYNYKHNQRLSFVVIDVDVTLYYKQVYLTPTYLFRESVRERSETGYRVRRCMKAPTLYTSTLSFFKIL